MRQRLEQIVYEIPKSQKRKSIYSIADLYYLSASALYSDKLIIRDFKESGFQMHLHDGAGGTAHIKTYDGKYQNIGSYEAAMMDLIADKLDIAKYIETDKSERTGRI